MQQRQEICGVLGAASDKKAIDIGLLQEGIGVIAVHTPAVKHRHAERLCRAVQFPQGRADVGAYGFRFRFSRRFARHSNCPYGLVGNDDLCGLVGDIAGYDFFNRDGQPVVTAMNDRIIGLSLEDYYQIPEVIAIAAENTKALALLGALRSGVVDTLATSMANALSILSLDQQ